MKCVLLGETDSEAVKFLEKNKVIITSDKKELSECEAISIRIDTKTDKTLLDKIPKLKYILANSVGVDHIDLNECSARGIKVFNAPLSNIDSVAELTIAHILSCLRNIVPANNELKKGEWRKMENMGCELMNKTVGIVGFGNIGRLVAKKLQGFDVRILAYDVIKDEIEARKLNATYVSLDKILKESDIITVHVPLIAPTKGMIGEKQFDMMKDGVIFLNMARGGVIIEEDLINELKSGKIKAAALDAFAEEPPKKSNPLLKMKNVITTPHLGGMTKEGFRRMCMEPAKKLIEELRK
ncbi:MAG: hydroxyacid dehydrogenase [Candidatus Omnitrophica bacterium]|nr:hydroxyacid dehydrogenase [Candidatus Omnitrophota bacterium]